METEHTTEPTAREKIEAACKDLGLSLTSEFVPFSKSRNAAPREDGKIWRSLNWRVTLRVTLYKAAIPGMTDAARDVLTTDYSAGEANCPAYKAIVVRAGGRDSVMRREMINYEIEHGREMINYEIEPGRAASPSSGSFPVGTFKGEKIQPDICDVIASLLLDSDVLDFGSFEEWAGNLGYDADSRKAEATYRACLEIALKMRNGIGEAGLAKLREACQDY